MRAPSSRDCARAFNRQSQRVTRRSPFWMTPFQPVPSHSGQTSAATFVDECMGLYGLCSLRTELRKGKAVPCCVQPVELHASLWTRVEIFSRAAGNVSAGRSLALPVRRRHSTNASLSRVAAFFSRPGAPECTTVYSWNQNHHLFAQNIGQDGVSAGITNRAVLECTNHAALPSYSQLTSEKLGAK